MRRGLLFSFFTVVLSATSPIWAATAADKATARELASAGITEFKAGNARGALEKLEKAQALFDAPIHLLYLARAHAQLGQLVEAAEYYRSLARVELGPNSNWVFRQAQKDGAGELTELEPRLAHLTIHVTPSPLAGLDISVDGSSINVAVLTVARATNPGTRRVVARAPGYLEAEKQIDLQEGDDQTVELVLTKIEVDTPVKQDTSGSPLNESIKESDLDSGNKFAPMGFVLGFRFATMIPFGNLEELIATSDYFHAGLAGRVHAGFRFAHHFGVKAFFDLGSLNPGTSLDERADAATGITSMNSARITDAGVALFATSNPHKFGGYGELGLSLIHQYKWAVKRTGANTAPCKNTAKYSGFAFRAGGGMNIPIGNFLTVAPSIDLSLGQHSKLTTDYYCAPLADEVPFPGATPLSKALHLQLFLGVGGDFHFGDSLFD